MFRDKNKIYIFRERDMCIELEFFENTTKISNLNNSE